MLASLVSIPPSFSSNSFIEVFCTLSFATSFYVADFLEVGDCLKKAVDPLFDPKLSTRVVASGDVFVILV
jgi:hypothetical protein